MELKAGTVFAGYRIEEVVGRGGMGVVYRATHLKLEAVRALKVVAPDLANDPDFQARFAREARVAASIDHPSVIPIYDAGEEEGTSYIAMRFVEGKDLQKLLRERGPVSPEEFSRIIGSVAGALDAAHAHGLVHRDVKPANVLVEDGPEGRIYLTDFGLTKALTSNSGYTGTGMMVGTPDYMAPEQWESAALDARTDIYSLGCLAYQLTSGQGPFPASGTPQKLKAHLFDDPPPLSRSGQSWITPELDAVVTRAMAKDPEERFSSAGEFARAVDTALDIEGTDAASTLRMRSERGLTPLPAIRRAIQRNNERTRASNAPRQPANPWRSRLIGAGIVAAAFAGGFLLFGGKEDPPGFVDSADAVCRSATIALAENQAKPASSLGGVDAKLRMELGIREAALAELKSLGRAPADLSEAWRQHLKARQARIRLGIEELRLVLGGTEPGSTRYIRLNAEGAEVSEAAASALAGTPFTACANELSREGEDQAVAIVKDVETEALSDCSAVLTGHAMRKLFGGAASCEAVRTDPAPEDIAEAVDIIDVRGVDDASATVIAIPSGGPRDGSTVMYGLLAEDGAFKVNNVTVRPEAGSANPEP